MRAKINRMLLGLVVLCSGTNAFATIVFPALELNPVSVNSNSSTLTMSGLAPYTLSDPLTILTDFTPDLSFNLTSDAAGVGTLSVTGSETLSASFTNLSVVYTDLLGLTTLQFNADLTYTGGTLVGSLGGGRIEGSLFANLGFSNGQSLLGETFTASGGIAKIGAVVPVPAAVWLFGSGLLGLVGIARRKTRT